MIKLVMQSGCAIQPRSWAICSLHVVGSLHQQFRLQIINIIQNVNAVTVYIFDNFIKNDLNRTQSDTSDTTGIKD